jgi:tRNA-specific 2-thiouridylase
LYVAAIDAERQRVIAGTAEEAARRDFRVEWERPAFAGRCHVQVRHRGKPLACEVDGERVILEEPALGVAPGQSAVFYRGDEVLGGARICKN